MKKMPPFILSLLRRTLLAGLLAVAAAAAAQPVYKEFRSTDGEVLYRYDDGYVVSQKDFLESARLADSASWWPIFGKAAQGLKAAQEAVRLNKKNHEAWEELASINTFYIKDYEAAIRAINEAMRLVPGYVHYYYIRHFTKEHQGDISGALSDLSERIRLDPENGQYYADRGDFKFDHNDPAGAMIDYAKGIELNPDKWITWWARGLAREKSGDLDGATSDFNQVIGINPKWDYCWYRLGLLKETKGEVEAAIKYYKKARELAPKEDDYPAAIRNAEAKLAALRPKRPPTVHLLAVGISRYQQDYMLSPLEFTVPGAYQMKSLFERRGLTRRAPLLNDSKARRRAIIDSLEALTNSARVLPEDLVIFYYSGHGLMAGGKLGICPYDYQTAADLIEDKTITEILSRCPARHKVCLIEACKNETSLDVLDPAEVRRFNESRRSLSAGIVYLTSTEVGRKSWGNSDGGYFTVAIVEGLDEGKADANGDRSVTAQELIDYVKKTVSGKTNNQQIPQVNNGYPQALEMMKLPK